MLKVFCCCGKFDMILIFFSASQAIFKEGRLRLVHYPHYPAPASFMNLNHVRHPQNLLMVGDDFLEVFNIQEEVCLNPSILQYFFLFKIVSSMCSCLIPFLRGS